MFRKNKRIENVDVENVHVDEVRVEQSGVEKRLSDVEECLHEFRQEFTDFKEQQLGEMND